MNKKNYAQIQQTTLYDYTKTAYNKKKKKHNGSVEKAKRDPDAKKW